MPPRFSTEPTLPSSQDSRALQPSVWQEVARHMWKYLFLRHSEPETGLPRWRDELTWINGDSCSAAYPTQLQFSPSYQQSQTTVTNLQCNLFQSNEISDISGLDKISWTRAWVSIGCGSCFLALYPSQVYSTCNQPWRNDYTKCKFLRSKVWHVLTCGNRHRTNSTCVYAPYWRDDRSL